MSQIKQLAKETLIYGGGNIASRVLNYVFLGMYLPNQLLGPEKEQFTAHGEIMFFVAILLVVLGLRFETAYFRFSSESEEKIVFSTAVISLILMAVLSVVAISLGKHTMAECLQYPAAYILIPACTLAFDLLYAIPMAKFRNDNRPIAFISLRLGMVFINIGLLLAYFELLPLLSSDWLSPLRSIDKIQFVFIAGLVASMFGFVLILPQYLRMQWKWDKQVFIKMLRYSAPLIIVSIAAVINQSSFVTFQRWFLGGDLSSNMQEAAPYLAASKIAILMSLFNVAFNYAVEPFFFNHAKKSKDRKVYAEVALAYTLVACLAFIGLSSKGSLSVVMQVLNDEYQTQMQNVPVLVFGFLMLGLYYNFSIWYKLSDKTIWGAVIAVFGMCITIVINRWGIPKWGIVASPIATVLCYSSMVLLCILFGRKFFRIPYAWIRLLKPIILSVILVIISYMIPSNNLLILIAFSLVSLLLLAVYSYLAERTFLLDIIKNRG